LRTNTHFALQLPRDNPIRQAIDLGRDRFIGRAYDPMRPNVRIHSLRALFQAAYPGMSPAIWNLARRLDDGTLADEARRRIKAKVVKALYDANREEQ
jgi:hypothetical protein